MTGFPVGARSKAKYRFRGFLPLAATATLCAGTAWAAQPGLAQVPTAPAPAGRAAAGEKHSKFEVVSIKRHTKDGPPVQLGPTPEGFRSIGVPFFGIFQWAYPLPNQRGLLRGDQIENAPAWLDEPYDVVAKIERADFADWQKPEMRQTLLRTMLQAMLAERCKVAVHYASKEASVYELVVAKTGPKVKAAETIDPAELLQKHPGAGAMRGSVTMALQGPNQTQYFAMSMSILANTMLSSLVDRPVLDKTGLTGYYDLALPSSALRRSPPPPPPGATSAPDATTPPQEDPSIFEALAALGLRLQPAKGQVGVLVIDRVERPSEN